MAKKVKIIKEISPKKKEIKTESELEEDISDIEDEEFGEFISTGGASAPVLEASEMTQEIPVEALPTPAPLVGGPEFERISYTTGRPVAESEEEMKRKYNPSIEAQPIKEREIIRNQQTFRNRELAGIGDSDEEREQKYMTPETKKGGK